MREVGILEAKTHLSALVEAVERSGEDIAITRHGRRVARLTPDIPGADNARPRKLSGAELLRMSRELQARISIENPASDKITWDELKRDMRQ
jgi:prevent-host-death family protein